MLADDTLDPLDRWLIRNGFNPSQPRDADGQFADSHLESIPTHVIVSGLVAGKGGVAFHGTSEKAIEGILKDGLVPNADKVWDKKLMSGSRAKLVFLSAKPSEAAAWAAFAAMKKGGDAYVVRVEIPAGTVVKRDSKTAGATHSGRIPREWITGYAKVTVNPDNNLKVASIGEFKSLTRNTGETYYAPLVVITK